ncbi:MAG: ATP-binding protein [Syntrophorhabdaceae bacterium]|nr:ATP-binding protein [Syntrophorhabdaceae bacterium]
MVISETELLKDAFSEFARASDSIINYYNVLETQIRLLKEEVEKKNRELERAKEYLHNILDSVPMGIVVLDQKSISFINKAAERLDSNRIIDSFNGSTDKSGVVKNGRGYYRWKKDMLQNGFKGKEVLIIEDVTEFEKMKERLDRDERLKAMGEMAARIAHEIKNPLGSMVLFLSMLSDGKLRKKDKKYVEYIRFGIQTIDRIINNILSYTRPKTLALKKEKITKVIEDILEFMMPSILSRNIDINYRVEYHGTSFFDPDMMKLVLMNFFSNAMDAIKGRGLIKIDVREEQGYIVIVINDNGIGMDDDTRKNIFNPFFTTKDKGVGLGLFIVHNIVHAHKGYIEVESQEGVGTTFFVYLPKERQQ